MKSNEKSPHSHIAQTEDTPEPQLPSEWPNAGKVIKKGFRRRGKGKQNLMEKDTRILLLVKDRNELIRQSSRHLSQTSIEARLQKAKEQGIDLPEPEMKALLELLDRIAVDTVIRPALVEIEKRYPKS